MAPAMAATQGPNVPDSGCRKGPAWENAAGDTSDGNDNYWKCTSRSDFNVGDDHSLPGDCTARVIPATSWNDCATSISVWVPSGRKLCVYAGGGWSSREGPIFVGPYHGTRVYLYPHAGIYDWLCVLRFVAATSGC